MASPRFAAMQAFASVFTIGHTTAKTLYDKYNCRTLEDVKIHYEAIAEETPEIREKEKMRRRRDGGMTHVDIVDVWMGLKEELDEK
jgi:DNA polymerase mu